MSIISGIQAGNWEQIWDHPRIIKLGRTQMFLFIKAVHFTFPSYRFHSISKGFRYKK